MTPCPGIQSNVQSDKDGHTSTELTSDIASGVVDREIVRRALEQVPAGQRAVLVLRYYEGLDVAGTAAALECSEGNVKSQTARGLAALKTALVRQTSTPGGSS